MSNQNESTAAAPAAPAVAERKKAHTSFERPVPTAEELEALEEKHGDVLLLNGSDMSPWSIIVRRPTRPETMKFKADSRREGNGAVLANEAFIRAIAVWPAPHVIDKMVSIWSMFPDAVVVAPAFKEFIGVAVDNSLKG